MGTLTEENVREIFSKDAFIVFKDPAVGDRVAQSKAKFSPEDVDCLDFCKRNVFEDMRVQKVLGALFPWSALIWYDVYRPKEGNTDKNAIITGRISEMVGVVVQLWSPKSSIIIYKDSNSLSIGGANGPTGMLQIAAAQIRQCDPNLIEFDDGGLVIFDARLVFTLVKGFVMQHFFISQELTRDWPPGRLPSNPGAEAKIRELSTPVMGTHFIFSS